MPEPADATLLELALLGLELTALLPAIGFLRQPARSLRSKM